MKYAAHEWLKAVKSLDPKSQSGAALHKGTGVDTLGFGEALIVMLIGVITSGGTYAWKVQESDTDVDGGYADITGAALATVDGDDGTLRVGRIKLGEGRKRWLRIVATDGTAAVVSAGCIILTGSPHRLPVTQPLAVAFNV